MGVNKPYKRLWRPLKGYSSLSEIWTTDEPTPKLDYLLDERFACQAEMGSLVTTAHLIIHDLYEVFNYIEPDDMNLTTFSHRLYELYLRTATEFESNCKGILDANGYTKQGNLNITDYFKIAAVSRLFDYKVRFYRWSSQRVFQPFVEWNTVNYAPLTWYQHYNEVKHNRYQNFKQANLENLMNALAGLLCILHAQCGELMQSSCFEGISMTQDDESKVVTGTFEITTPVYPDAEQYEFIWDNIKASSDPVQNYTF